MPGLYLRETLLLNPVLKALRGKGGPSGNGKPIKKCMGFYGKGGAQTIKASSDEISGTSRITRK